MLGLFAAFASIGSAEAVPLEIVASELPMAPATLTVTASTPIDEPVIAYAWSGLGREPRCRSKTCPVELPIASCRRVEVMVTDRFGEDTTSDTQVCATEDGFMPPRAEIRIEGLNARGIAQAGDATVTRIDLWVDGTKVGGAEAQLEEGCHVVDLAVVDDEGRIGIDQRITCPVEEPRIWVGASPSFCPLIGQPVQICTEVDDPSGRGLTSSGGVPLDDCISLTAPTELSPILVRGETEGRSIFASTLACASAPGRPTIVFARIDPAYVFTRDRTERVVVNIDGGAGPFEVTGLLRGRGGSTETASVTTGFAELAFMIPSNAAVTELLVTVKDSRGLMSSALAEVSMAVNPDMPPPPPANALNSDIGCSSSGAPSLLVLLPWILISRRRRR